MWLVVEDGTWFGIDIDTKNELRLLMTYLNASRFGKTTVAETRHGYHIRVFLKCSRETAMQLRKLLGDDDCRIAFEELEIHRGIKDWQDTLFLGKTDEDGKWHYEESVENVLMLPFLSRIKPIKKPLRKKGRARPC
jgi:predicted ATPase